MSHQFHPVSSTSASLNPNSFIAREILDASNIKYKGQIPPGSLAARIQDARNAGKEDVKIPIESVRELQSLDMITHNGIEPKRGLMCRVFGQTYGHKVGHV